MTTQTRISCLFDLSGRVALVTGGSSGIGKTIGLALASARARDVLVGRREADMPAFAQTTVARLASDLEVFRQQGFRLAVVDTPPAITMAIQSVIAVAELIIIPTRPSPLDLRAVGATVDLCDRAG